MDFAEIGKPPKGHFADSKVTGVIGLAFPDAIVAGIEKTFMDQIDSEEQSFEISIAKNPDHYVAIAGLDGNNALMTLHTIYEPPRRNPIYPVVMCDLGNSINVNDVY